MVKSTFFSLLISHVVAQQADTRNFKIYSFFLNHTVIYHGSLEFWDLLRSRVEARWLVY